MSNLLTFPTPTAASPGTTIGSGRYELRFARSPVELDRILELRYRVFNLELNEGLDASAISGRDEDEFDRRFHHLLIEERKTGAVVGTYRMQTADMARANGYYSGGLFQVECLPESIREAAVEIGRACVAKAHRNGRVLHLLWRGLAAYLSWNRKTMLFGCCSLTSQDEALGRATHEHLVSAGHQHATASLEPRPSHACRGPDPTMTGPTAPVHIPALFRAYLAIGAKVLGPPAIDREFKTIDWLVLLNTDELPALARKSFFR